MAKIEQGPVSTQCRLGGMLRVNAFLAASCFMILLCCLLYVLLFVFIVGFGK